MSRRETDRERESRRSAAATNRTNEYFVPKDGIDREVITADICRYLGNDALVRPGTHENRETRQAIPGYFITAYRNLTTAMIADLKADSSRWDDERRATASRGQPANVGYRDSNTHHTRQYYGPSSEAVSTPSGSGYTPSSAASGVSQQEVYPQGYGSGPNYTQQAPGYGGPPSGYVAPHQPDNYSYASGAHFSLAQEPDVRGGRGGPIPPAQSVPRAGYPAQPPVSYPGNVGGGYYPQVGQQPSVPTQYGTQSGEYYGRHSPAVAGSYADPQDEYHPESRQYEQPVYSQGPIQSSTTATANQGARRGDGRGDRDDRNDRHSRPHGSSSHGSRRS